MKHKILATILITVASVIILFGAILLAGVAWLIYAANGGPFHSFAQYSSDNGENRITIEARDPVWPFGSQEFKIILRGENCGSKTITTQLSNDGKQAYDGYEVQTQFKDDAHAVIVFDGEEQKPETIEIFFDAQNRTIEVVQTKATVDPLAAETDHTVTDGSRGSHPSMDPSLYRTPLIQFPCPLYEHISPKWT